MKRAILTLLSFWLLLSGHQLPAASQTTAGIVVRMPAIIRAGDGVTITVKIAPLTDGRVDAVLLNGAQRLDQAIPLNARGVGIWRIDEGVLIQSGMSVLVLDYQGMTHRHSFEVEPHQPHHLELLTSARTIPAHTQGLAMLMVIASDQWGNMAQSNRDFPVMVRYPSGARQIFSMPIVNGLGWRWLASSGLPGRIRISAGGNGQSANLELFQVAGPPATINLTLSPDCVLSDGRDLFQLSALVTDKYGEVVVDGTLVTFYWEGGQGYGAVADGVAILRLPAPADAGDYTYWAKSGEATTSPIILTIREDRCS